MDTNAPQTTQATPTALETFRAISEARRILNAVYGPAARMARDEGHTFQVIAEAGDITRPTVHKLIQGDAA